MAFLAYILSLLITVSATLPTDYESNKTKDVASCPCALAKSVFDESSDGPVKGLVVYAQDECGHTTITGIFSKGFEDTSKNYRFKIVDSCGTVVHDLTSGLNVRFDNFGGTKVFRNKFRNINLNCNRKGILSIKPKPLINHTCKKIFKRRRRSRTYMRVNQDGRSYSQASIRKI